MSANRSFNFKQSIGLFMKKTLLTIALSLGAVLPLSAKEFIFEDFRLSLFDSTMQPWTGMFEGNVQLGAFNNMFTPSLSNTGSWFANWSTAGAGGYYDSAGPEWSAQLLLNDNSVFSVGQQLSLWVFDSPVGGSEWAVFTDPSWLVTVSSGLDTTPSFFEFTNDTVALFGSFDYDAGVASTISVGAASAVPEPSYTLFAGLGMLGLVLYRKAKQPTPEA